MWLKPTQSRITNCKNNKPTSGLLFTYRRWKKATHYPTFSPSTPKQIRRVITSATTHPLNPWPTVTQSFHLFKGAKMSPPAAVPSSVTPKRRNPTPSDRTHRRPHPRDSAVSSQRPKIAESRSRACRLVHARNHRERPVRAVDYSVVVAISSLAPHSLRFSFC